MKTCSPNSLKTYLLSSLSLYLYPSLTHKDSVNTPIIMIHESKLGQLKIYESTPLTKNRFDSRDRIGIDNEPLFIENVR